MVMKKMPDGTGDLADLAHLAITRKPLRSVSTQSPWVSSTSLVGRCAEAVKERAALGKRNVDFPVIAICLGLNGASLQRIVDELHSVADAN